MSQTAIKQPLIIGEVLFDCFGNRRVLGGAPFNVAWNLKGLAIEPMVSTAVGKDEFGADVLRSMKDWHLDASIVEILQGRATGRVEIQIHAGQPTYNFWSDVAFDYILGS